MNQHLQNILNSIQQDKNMSEEEKNAIIKSLKDANKELEITNFKLDRTEKVKRTTAILLEETIEELEQKRKAVEAQNRELEIESSLERVRTVAMSMNKADDMLLVCRMISEQLELLNVKDIRNVQTAIIYETKGNYLNFEYYTKHDKTFITDVDFKTHPAQFEFVNEMLKGPEEFFSKFFKGTEVQDWYDYQKTTNQFSDSYLATATSLNYYFYSMGPVALGMSTYTPLNEEEILLFKRFRNVFELAYRRFLDIEKAIAQAKEAQIETSLERVRAQAMAMRTPEELTGISEVLYAELKTLGFTEIRNAMINIHDDEKETFVNYDYSDEIGKSINHLTYNIHPLIEKQIKQIRSGDGFSETFYTGKDLEDMITFRKNIGEKDDPRINKAASLYYYFYSIGNGSIGISTFSVVVGEKLEVLKRFRNVFTLSYQRYADIALAEAQAKEARIETALERVRAVAMAMRNPADLSGISETLFNELKSLGFSDLRNTEIIINNDKKETIISYYYSDYGRTGILEMDYKTNQVVHKWADDLRKADDAFAEVVIPEKDLIEWEKFAQSVGYLPDTKLDKIKAIYYYSYSIGLGALSISSFTSVAKEQVGILERFRNVFNLSYQRYSDIALAEAQSREAKIELALERVRARTMAMQKSEELPETAFVLYQQFKELGEDPIQITIGIMNEAEGVIEFNVTDWAGGGSQINNPFNLSIEEPTLLKKAFTAWKAQKKSLVVDLTGKDLEQWIEYRNANTGVTVSSKDTDGRRVINIAFFSKGHISISSPLPRPKETIDLLERFAGVFDQTYTRFLDLQKAETQAKEAKIETALERVRSKTMTMHNSQDVGDTVAAMFDELVKLGIEKTMRCGIIIIDDTKQMEVWNASDNGEGKINLVIGRLDMTIHPALGKVYDAWKNKLPEISYEFIGEDLKDYFRVINNSPEYPFQMDIASLPSRSFLSDYFFADGAIFAFTHDAIATETTQIFKRFAAVFGQTYRRYLDLLKAEAQAREAQIEVSLERVRAQTMAMNKSQDLQEVVAVIFRELDKQDLKTIRCGIGIINGQNRSVNVWSTTITEEGSELNFSGNESMDIHPVLQGAFAGWQKQEDFYAVLEGEALISYYDTQKGDNYKLPDAAAGVTVSENDRQYYFCTYFPAGGIYFFKLEPFTEELVKLIRRFASAFSLAYKRFEDLKQSEARALEVIKESSLDRVRAETASMRTTSDLERITPLIWNELTTLGVPFIRCGVFIIDEAQQQVHTFLSTPDGKAIAAFHLPFNTSEQIKQIVIHWQQNKLYKDHWDEAAFDEWTNTLVEKGIIQPQEQYLTSSHPANLHLHFLPFLQGMLYVGSNGALSKEEILLIQSLAGAFSSAYARYEDFNKLELAKEQIEKTLVDLKQAQTQLVQSEKMASLGELTAGIAHEIQNPLNFVNNFSEVNTELIEELKAERSKVKGERDEKLEDELLSDISLNLEKINHHGKRADAIVKGMLQHSRTSTATKEPTDINKLADEYLRLAYHGLRAKDKSFNATLKTDYDETLEKINIIPQDIGRVILNLITNAFYAVAEKDKMNVENYEPTVTVKTSQTPPSGGRGAIISVKDNGNGISQKIVDKIFQPFFTTKPTGQGTGLGLSLAYDIVKAHGGELKVETKEGEGSEFIIQLPIV